MIRGNDGRIKAIKEKGTKPNIVETTIYNDKEDPIAKQVETIQHDGSVLVTAIDIKKQVDGGSGLLIR